MLCLKSIHISFVDGECYEATVSSDFYAADIFYQGFYDEVPQKLKARANKESKSLLSFRIYGRWGEGHYDEDSQLYERDRVLVSSKALVYLDRHTRLKDMSKDQYLKNTYYWVDTDIIRLIDICK